MSRSIGDRFAKDESVGGNPKALISDADVFEYKVEEQDDFIVMGSKEAHNPADGMFDKLEDGELVAHCWKLIRANNSMAVNKLMSLCACSLARLAYDVQSSDNLSCVIIALPGLLRSLT